MPVHVGVQRIIFPAVPWIVTYGPFDGTTAGENLRIVFTSNFTVDEATLILSDGRELVLAINGDELSCLLPPDTPDGWADVRLHNTRGETRTDKQVVLLHGIPAVQPQPPSPMPTGRRRKKEPQPELRVIGSRVGVRSATLVTARQAIAAPSRLVLVTRTRASLVAASVVPVVSTTGVSVRLSAGSAASTVGETAVARRDGQALEEALLLGELVTGCAFVD